MPLTRARWTAALAVALVACEQKATTPAVIREAAPTDANAPPARVSEAELLALGRAVNASALAIAKTCHIHAKNVFSGEGFFWAYDVCRLSDKELDSLSLSLATFRAPADAAGGHAQAFAVEAAQFREYVSLTTSDFGGTLAHYQHVARSWNAWQPKLAVTLDPVEPPSYMRDDTKPSTGPLKWQRCANQPCIVLRSK